MCGPHVYCVFTCISPKTFRKAEQEEKFADTIGVEKYKEELIQEVDDSVKNSTDRGDVVEKEVSKEANSDINLEEKFNKFASANVDAVARFIVNKAVKRGIEIYQEELNDEAKRIDEWKALLETRKKRQARSVFQKAVQGLIFKEEAQKISAVLAAESSTQGIENPSCEVDKQVLAKKDDTLEQSLADDDKMTNDG